MGRVRSALKQLIIRPMPKPEPAPLPFISYLRRETFEAAEKEAGIGYQNPDLLKDDAPDPANPDLRLLPDFYAAAIASFSIVLSQVPRRPLRVLDFGGSKGGHCHIIKSALGLSSDDLDWSVVETDLYVDRAKRYPQRGIQFFRTIDEVGDVDIAIFSGVLHFLRDCRAFLEHPHILDAPYVLTSRTPVGEAQLPYLQIVRYPQGTVSYAGRVMAESEITGALSSTHERLIGWDLAHHMVEMGIISAPTVLWRRR